MKRWLLALLFACSCGPCCPCENCPCEGAQPQTSLDHAHYEASGAIPVAVHFDWSPPAAHHAAVVQVQAGNYGGSGAYVQHDGVYMILTCQHVAAGGSTMTATFRDGTKRSGQPRTDKFGHDIAGMIVEPHPTIPPLKFADRIPASGRVEMLGYAGPAGKLRHWWGTVAGDSSVSVTKYDAGVGSGDSGGPVLDEQHHLVGLLAHGEQPNDTEGWKTYNRAGGPAWTPLRNFAIRLRAFANPSGTNPPLNQRPAQGGCGPGGCFPQQPYGGGGQLYPPDEYQAPPPAPQPTPAAPDERLLDIEARLLLLESRKGEQGPPGKDGRDGKDGNSPSAAEVAAALQPSLPTAEQISAALFAGYSDQLAAKLADRIPPLYVEVIDPTGKYSAPPQAIRFMEGEGLRLTLDPTQIVLPKAE